MEILRHIPAVHQLQEDPRFTELMEKIHISERVLTEWLSEQIEVIRNKIIRQGLADETLGRDKLIEFIFEALDQKVTTFSRGNLQTVINATGVVLHTNLGRARLSKQAVKQIAHAAANYSTLEFNLKTGDRGSRHDIVEEYLTHITGAEAAVVVNNNAAAVYLVLKAIASGKEVIVSRGELVEIGGSFRISEIMKESQAVLVEVGTTNKTHIEDYERAITEDTALFLKVHKSNFALIGFAEDVDTEELAVVSRQQDIPIYEDLGSGTLVDFRKQRIGTEPTVQDKVRAGIDIISFSGDKLLGGPQAGVIIGRKIYIDKIKKHQLARVLRVDKFTLAGLEATLKSYVRGKELYDIPTVRDILESAESVLEKANRFMEKLTSKETKFACKIEPSTSKVGGGTMPDVDIDTYVVIVKHNCYKSAELAEKLRNFRIPIIVRVKNEAVLLDFRTVEPEELDTVVEAFLHIQQEEIGKS